MPAAGPGFQDTIAILYGFKPGDKLVVGMEVLESRETPGLGDKIYKDAEWVAGFSALSVEPEIFAVKKGTKSSANEIDAITGATISSKAVVRIINETHTAWLAKLPPSGSEPSIPETETSGDEAGQ
jgi:electron transport complex protein RnfG